LGGFDVRLRATHFREDLLSVAKYLFPRMGQRERLARTQYDVYLDAAREISVIKKCE
jgi:hypothetical protein